MYYNWEWYNQKPTGPNYFVWIIIALVLFDVILKGFALWRSAQNKQKWWFIFLFIINSVGILPAIYLLTHPPKKKK